MILDIAGLILAGGKSQRFGSDKALYEIDGKSMIKRQFDIISTVADPVFISKGDSDRIYDLPGKDLIDHYPDAGPLAGLHAGLLAADTAWVVVLATDMPFVTVDVLEQLIDQCGENCDAVVAKSGDRIQPLCGCYRSELAASIEQRLQQQSNKVLSFIDTIRIKTIQVAPVILANINRVQDLKP